MVDGSAGVLNGQVAVVSGCARRKGLGRGTALALARAGADLVLTDVDPGGDDGDGLPGLVREIEKLGRRATAVVADVGRSEDVERLVSTAVSELGRIDILVNNAAAPHGADRNWTWEVPEEAFDEVLRINTKGVFLMSTAVVRHLIGRNAPGRIVNIASVGGRRGFPRRAAYCASKFGVLGLTESMALELADRGITVNAVCPGSVDTSRREAGVAAPKSPVPRMGDANDVALAVLYLVDPGAGYVTGQALTVDGGLLLT